MLEEISFSVCDEHVDLALAALVQHCPALKALCCDSEYFTANSLQILRNCCLLHTVEIKSGTVSTSALMHFLEFCFHLQRLDVSGVLTVVADEVDAPASTPTEVHSSVFPNLIRVGMDDCDILPDEAFIPLVAR